MQVVNVSGSSPYPVYIGSGLLRQLGSLYRRHDLSGRAFIISDESVINLYSDAVIKSLKASDVEPITVGVPPGETSKNLDMADQLYERLIKNRYQRNDVVVALGGGVVGDLAGFVAATYQRGVPLIQIPTTLLAQVDSSVGGKTGVNHRLGKNLIGAFYSPSLVVADLSTLKTLPKREWNSGMAEVIKYGLIADRTLYGRIESQIETLNAGDPELELIIHRCVEIKADVVGKDEKENDLRKILNFGHTLGHALESMTEYQHFLHGEAIYWGMLGEAYLSFKYGHLAEMEFVRIKRLINRIEKPGLPVIDSDAFLDHVYRDKKNRDGRIHMAWLRNIGQCRPDPIEPDKLLTVLDFWREEASQPV